MDSMRGCEHVQMSATPAANPSVRDDKHTDARSDCYQRNKMGDAEAEGDTLVSANKLDDESQGAGTSCANACHGITSTAASVDVTRNRPIIRPPQCLWGATGFGGG
jgi:hypothetical protein